jgi:uncharacterized protein (TIGR03118 family)
MAACRFHAIAVMAPSPRNATLPPVSWYASGKEPIMPDRLRLFAIALFVFIAAGKSGAADSNNYQVTILVSNETGVAPVTDTNLVNAWGIAASSGSPWWVANNGTGTSTLYTGAGVKQSLTVTVPGAPTGMIFSGASHFNLAANRPATFMWASEDGTISGWNPQFDATHAHVVFTSPGSNYKGLSVSGETLYTTDFAECKVETINNSFHSFETDGGFEDGSIPESYCPFGIQVIGGSVFVSYALKGGDDDVAGVSHGLVREFDLNGHLMTVVANHGTLNSPWGMAIAPADFGRFSNCLLVGNFGDGLINAFCRATNGTFNPAGRLKTDHGRDIRIDGLWGIGFGNGRSSGPTNVLYFAAGPDEETNGYFGRIDRVD